MATYQKDQHRIGNLGGGLQGPLVQSESPHGLNATQTSKSTTRRERSELHEPGSYSLLSAMETIPPVRPRGDQEMLSHIDDHYLAGFESFPAQDLMENRNL
eukprot:c36530_g1_i1 orf=42-344(-)